MELPGPETVVDAETVETLSYGVRWHYALNLPGETDTGK